MATRWTIVKCLTTVKLKLCCSKIIHTFGWVWVCASAPCMHCRAQMLSPTRHFLSRLCLNVCFEHYVNGKWSSRAAGVKANTTVRWWRTFSGNVSVFANWLHCCDVLLRMPKCSCCCCARCLLLRTYFKSPKAYTDSVMGEHKRRRRNLSIYAPDVPMGGLGVLVMECQINGCPRGRLENFCEHIEFSICLLCFNIQFVWWWTNSTTKLVNTQLVWIILISRNSIGIAWQLFVIVFGVSKCHSWKKINPF